MADPKVAALGRLEGITLEITGATGEKTEAEAAGLAASGDGDGGQTAPRLFGSELLYEHPEILLAVADAPEDPTLKPPPPKVRPTISPAGSTVSAGAKKSTAKKKPQQKSAASRPAARGKQGAFLSGGGGAGAGAAAAAAVAAAAGGGAGLDADEASAVMEDMNEAEDVLGVEDIFSGV